MLPLLFGPGPSVIERTRDHILENAPAAVGDGVVGGVRDGLHTGVQNAVLMGLGAVFGG